MPNAMWACGASVPVMRLYICNKGPLADLIMMAVWRIPGDSRALFDTTAQHLEGIHLNLTNASFQRI